MADATIIQVLILFFLIDTLIIIIVLWFFFRMMGRLFQSSGFPGLYEIWPAGIRPPGKRFSRQYVALNGVWYHNAANLVITDEGLYLSFGFPVSLTNHRAVLIPWKNIRYLNKKRAFWTDVYEYQILMERPLILTVMKRIARSFPESLKPEW